MTHRKSKTNLFLLQLILIIVLILISGGALVYQLHQTALREQERERYQKNREEQKKQKKQYDLQQEELVSVADLASDPKIDAFFTDLLKTYAEKFAKSKELDISHLPLKFAGFYSSPDTDNGYREMGVCQREQKTAKISLNRLYLLNKLGHDKYFIPKKNTVNYASLPIGFDKMISSCSHELAHYIQLVKHGESSCESDLILNTGKYDKKLAKEHERFIKEIHKMIKSSEYSKLEKN